MAFTEPEPASVDRLAAEEFGPPSGARMIGPASGELAGLRAVRRTGWDAARLAVATAKGMTDGREWTQVRALAGRAVESLDQLPLVLDAAVIDFALSRRDVHAGRRGELLARDVRMARVLFDKVASGQGSPLDLFGAERALARMVADAVEMEALIEPGDMTRAGRALPKIAAFAAECGVRGFTARTINAGGWLPVSDYFDGQRLVVHERWAEVSQDLGLPDVEGRPARIRNTARRAFMSTLMFIADSAPIAPTNGYAPSRLADHLDACVTQLAKVDAHDRGARLSVGYA